MSSPGLFLRFSHTVSHLAGKPMTFARGQVWVVLLNDGKPHIP